MGSLTNNLSRPEFACRCNCGFDTADFDLVNILQDVVDHFGTCYILITGPNRCKEHNKAEGGAPDSQHIYGRAADFKIIDTITRQPIKPINVYRYLDDKYPGRYGLGLYSNRVHFDTRSGLFARWGA